jgi:hypothetical protein
VQTERAAREQPQILHRSVGFSVIATPFRESEVMLYVTGNFANKAERIGFVVTKPGIRIVDEPVINLIFSND